MVLGVEKMLHLLCAQAHRQAWQTLPNGALLSPKHKPRTRTFHPSVFSRGLRAASFHQGYNKLNYTHK
jgi:hypothetical protein